MGYRSDVRDMISDYVILLERQVAGCERSRLHGFIECMGMRSGANFPDLFLDAGTGTVFFKFTDGRTERITAENLRPCMDCIAFLERRGDGHCARWSEKEGAI